MLFGAIEGGGTKFVCGVGDENGNIHEQIQFPTTTPSDVFKQVKDFFQGKAIQSIGIGSFGPVDLNEQSETYGFITSTPKTNWKQTNVVGELVKLFSVPIGFDTDVNAAALGEFTWGAAQEEGSCLYVTVGTGIGVGAVIGGRLVHGLIHPEMGHTFVKRHSNDSFQGVCPFHKDCLEGMASGPAIEKRWGAKAADFENRPEVWELESFYLAQGIANFILTLSPEKVIIGGGVAHQKQLFPLIHKNVQLLLNGYLSHERILHTIDRYIVPPALGNQAGLCGGLALAKLAFEREEKRERVQP